MTCPNCGRENKEGEHFCEECGAQLNASDVTTPTGGATNPTASLAVGASLQNGRYVIVKALGEGGMGSVLLAKDTRLAGKLTVVKVLNTDSTDPEKMHEEVRNFQREAETLAHLNHPLIPDVTDHFEEGSRYYMVMEYVEGENLEHRLEQTNRSLPEEETVRYALEVLDILEYLSRQKPAIVHRDIKPANIIIGVNDKHAHLVDFGIARANTTSSGQRRKTTALGTPGYAPPEQYQGYADPRSDLYALGATIHHLVTNRDPGDNAPFQFPPIRTLNPRLSPQLELILLKALKTDLNERYQTPQEMRRDMEELLVGTPVLDVTDGYKLSGPLTKTRPARPRRPTQPATPTRPAGETPVHTAERVYRPPRAPERNFSEPEPEEEYAYQRQRERDMQQSRQIFEPRSLPPEYLPQREIPNPFGYRQDLDDNQLMWRFIIFVVAISLIILIAFFLFRTLFFI